MTETRWAISSSANAGGPGRCPRAPGPRITVWTSRDGFIVYDKPTLQKVYDLFQRVTPSLVFAHAPRDYMMDHEMCSLLARAASFLYGAPNCSEFPRHPESQVPYLYYCDPVEALDPLGNKVVPTTYVDITNYLDKKAEALCLPCRVSGSGFLPIMVWTSIWKACGVMPGSAEKKSGCRPPRLLCSTAATLIRVMISWRDFSASGVCGSGVVGKLLLRQDSRSSDVFLDKD